MIRLVCAWCAPETLLRLVPSLNVGIVDSHGICAEHKARLLAVPRFAAARMIERAKEIR